MSITVKEFVGINVLQLVIALSILPKHFFFLFFFLSESGLCQNTASPAVVCI